MGNVLSIGSPRTRATSEVRSENEIETAKTSDEMAENTNTEFHETEDEEKNVEDEGKSRAEIKEDEMNQFKKQLSLKREQRREILAQHRAQKERLIKSLEAEKKMNLELSESNKVLYEILKQNNIEIPKNIQMGKDDNNLSSTIAYMKEEFEILKTSNNKLRQDLALSNRALQSANSDLAELSVQNTESIKQIKALKEVIAISKTMASLREHQLSELKNKLNEIEKSLADREANMLSADLKQEYERQLQNIRTLRGLYEERARLAEATRLSLLRDLEEQRILKEAEINKCQELTSRVENLEVQLQTLEDHLELKNEQISSCQEEARGLKLEMSAVNMLFAQVLLGYKTNKDLDKMVHRLEEHHGLLTQMAEKENGSEASSALPKLLLELVTQVDEGDKTCEPNALADHNTELTKEECEATDLGTNNSLNTSVEEIVQNLPKVWRVLMELLSHQSVTESNAEKVTTCYKSVDTKSGPVLVPSVSQTYIRLKDLIIEKLALIKEVNRMKQLNVHLETRLEEQERRLCLVTSELSKTWHVVGRLRRYHHQLHTHEKILKYELQQKRKLLNELKEELEYCREKWEQAREKNTQSERDWKKLRAEFTSRKANSSSPSNHNSAESGYSDERPSEDSSESNEESEYHTEPIVRCKKKVRKSFDTMLDSSTDFNLTAEREDPASDMLDVADLPLDIQGCEDHQESSISDSCNSTNLLKQLKLYEETEDEIGDITDDLNVETLDGIESNDLTIDSTKFISKEIKNDSISGNNRLLSETKNNSFSILSNIEKENEKIFKKDEILENFENEASLNEVKSTISKNDQIKTTLDHIINQPTTSKQPESELYVVKNKSSDKTETLDLQLQVLNINPKAILESIKLQNERLAKKDKRLENLEYECSEVVGKLSKTLNTSNTILQRLDFLPDKSQTYNSRNTAGTEIFQNIRSEAERKNLDSNENDESIARTETAKGSNNNEVENLNLPNFNSDENTNYHDLKANISLDKNENEASTSHDPNHEARFAAREVRLKRLEEQTKSLVNKVNHTTTKGVKIHYKLQELHNIYGSEGSRASTPSEDSEERSENDENDNN